MTDSYVTVIFLEYPMMNYYYYSYRNNYYYYYYYYWQMVGAKYVIQLLCAFLLAGLMLHCNSIVESAKRVEYMWCSEGRDIHIRGVPGKKVNKP